MMVKSKEVNDESNQASQLDTIFKRLSIQSKDAIINENDFDSFKEYMHIERPIERKFEAKLLNHVIPKNKSIIFIIGNVGDGKSHLLSYMTKKYHDEFNENNINIHNDATETNAPQNTAVDTLLEVLYPYSDSELNNGESCRLIIAINLGILTNLITVMEEVQGFSELVRYIEETNVTNNHETISTNHDIFDFVSFREDRNFEYDGAKLSSEFYSQALARVFEASDNNPFYEAYRNDTEQGIESILHTNYEFMLRPEFQESLTYLLIRAEIENKAIISARDLFNLFYDICNPRDSRESFDSYLPYLLFDNANKSELLTIMSYFDPAKVQTRATDETAIQLYHARNTFSEVLRLLGEEAYQFRKVFESLHNSEEVFDDFFNTYLRVKYLLNYKDSLFDNRIFEEYIQEYFNIQQDGNYREMVLLIERAMERWYGESPKEKHIVRETSNNDVKLILAIKLVPMKPFIQQGVMVFPFDFGGDIYNLEVDYQVFKVLKQVDSGYFLKEEDYQIAVQFDRFVKHYLYSQELLEENYLYNLDAKNIYKLSNNYGQIELTKEV